MGADIRGSAVHCPGWGGLSEEDFLDSGEILRHAVGQLRKAAAATARNLNEAVILTEAPSGETATARGARSQKKSISSAAKEILSHLEEEIFFVFLRNRF